MSGQVALDNATLGRALGAPVAVKQDELSIETISVGRLFTPAGRSVPEFTVHLSDGRVLTYQVARKARAWWVRRIVEMFFADGDDA